jgi:hypothetical protein
MTAASIVAMVVGLLGAAGSIAAILVGFGRVLAGIDSLREESRKRGDAHETKIDALRTDVAKLVTSTSVSDHKVATLEGEVSKLRATVHDHANHLQKLLAKVID